MGGEFCAVGWYVVEGLPEFAVGVVICKLLIVNWATRPLSSSYILHETFDLCRVNFFTKTNHPLDSAVIARVS